MTRAARVRQGLLQLVWGFGGCRWRLHEPVRCDAGGDVPMTWATQYPVPSVFRFREWKICRCFGGTVVYVHTISTEMNPCAQIVTRGNAYIDYI